MNCDPGKWSNVKFHQPIECLEYLQSEPTCSLQYLVHSDSDGNCRCIENGTDCRDGRNLREHIGVNVYEMKLQSNQLSGKIPKVIYQTYKSEAILPEKLRLMFQKFAPEYEWKFYDDLASRQFIQRYRNAATLKIYDDFSHNAHRADLFRYAILYEFGGIYLDIETQLIQPLRDIFDLENTLYTVLSKNGNSVMQGVLATPPKNPIFNILIDEMLLLKDGASSTGYFKFTKDFYTKLHESIKPSQPEPGYLKNRRQPQFDYFLFQEKCSKDASECDDGLDKNGLCCYIYRNDYPVIKTRFADFGDWI